MGDISKPSMGLKPEDEEILINKVILLCKMKHPFRILSRLINFLDDRVFGKITATMVTRGHP